jgi:Protein of unknown function (DUF433)
MSTMTDRITVDPAVCGGRPCIRGLRIRVRDVLDLLAAGATRDEILEDYPLSGVRRHHCRPGVCCASERPPITAERRAKLVNTRTQQRQLPWLGRRSAIIASRVSTLMVVRVMVRVLQYDGVVPHRT